MMKHPKTSFVIGSLMSFALIASPFAAMAKDNGNQDSGHGKSGRASLVAQAGARISGWGSGIGNAFGHAIAPGWNRLFGTGVAKADASPAHRGDGENDDDATSSNSDPAAMPPVISGVSSPTVLKVGTAGTWTISASDPQNGNLSYAVDWGDQALMAKTSASIQPAFTQTASFSHAYGAPGTYKVTFTVKDDAGLTSKSSVTVHVVQNADALAISNVIATSTRPHSATVSWTTSLKANSKVWFGTASPIDPSLPPRIARSAKVLNHKIVLNGLAAGTTYYVVVGSGASGNNVTAPQTSFVTPSEASKNPTIVSFTGPATIAALAQGTWTVSASDPRNSPLSYSVDWGDAPMTLLSFFAKQPVFVQTATFDHAYANPGTYTITVTAKDSAGLSASATTSVTVTAATTSAPALSGITASSTVSDRATIAWNTDQPADSRIWFGTSSSIDTSLAPNLTDAILVTGHSDTLTGLSASTTYFYAVGSMNAGGQIGTSSVRSFTTAPAPASPIAISNLTDSVGTSTIGLAWNTNVAADTEIYFSTVSPLVVSASTTKSIIDPTLVTSHANTLTGLATSTTYFFVIQSKDASNNTASSSQFSVTTLAI